MNIRLNANAVVVNKEGKILLIRLKKGPFKGALCIPGGGVEPGELSHETAKREVFEETGVEVSGFKPYGFCELIHSGISQHKIVMLMHAKGEGEPKNTEEGEAFWMTYEDAEPELLSFAKEALRIWKNKELHFKLIESEVDIRDMPSKT